MLGPTEQHLFPSLLIIHTMESNEEHDELDELDEGNILLKATDTEPPAGWREKRKRTMAVFLLISFGEGFTFTTIFTTLWSYVNKSLLHSEPNFAYGLIASGRFVGPILLGGVASRWFDKTRSMRLFMTVVTVVVSAGCVVYTINASPYIPAMGSMLFGVGTLLQVAVNSELLRVYNKDEVQHMFLYCLIFYGLGEATGPVIVKLLDKVHFQIGWLEICYGNIAGLILLIFNIFKLLSIIFFTSDLSKEFDLKAQEQDKTGAKSFSSWSSILKQSFSLDAAFLLFQQFYTGAAVSFLCRTFPLVVDTLHYSDFILDVCFFAASISMMVISIVATRMKLSQKGVYLCGVLCLLGILLAHIALFLLPLGFSRHLNSFLLSVLVVGYGFCWVTDQTFIVVTLGKMVPSCAQSSVEGIRLMIHLVGSLLASFFSAYMYKEFNYVMLISIPIAFFLLIIMAFRRNVLT